MISATSATRKEEVYGLLREKIRRGEFAPGSALSEIAVAEMLRVSRTPVREALQRLSAEGVVAVYPNRGAFVKVMTPRDVTELFEVREALEGFAVRKAVGKLGDSQRRQVRDLIEKVRRQRRMTPAGLHGCWDTLREMLLARVENERIRKILSDIRVQIDVARYYSTLPPGRVEEIRGELLELAAAVLAEKGREAENIVGAHLRRSKEVVLSLVSSVPVQR